MIDGVIITPLRQILDERGKVMHMLRRDASHFQGLGEIYFSGVYPGEIVRRDPAAPAIPYDWGIKHQ